MSTPKDSSSGPPRPASTKPVSKPHASSAPPRLRQISVPKGGPGQTWLDLTKDEVDKHMRAESQSKDQSKDKDKDKDKGTGWSLARILRRLIGRT